MMIRESDKSGDSSRDQRSTSEVIGQARLLLVELGQYVAHYVSAQLDLARGSVRSAILYAAALAMTALLAVTILVSAGVLAVLGAAGMVNWLVALIAGRSALWVGQLIVGLSVLTVAGAAGWAALAGTRRRWRQRTLRKYETLHEQQRRRFGRDIGQCAGREGESAETH